MVANINPETGIAYGVIHGNNVPFLLDEIISYGTDLSYAAWKKEVISRISNILASHVQDGDDGADSLAEIFSELSSWRDKEDAKRHAIDCLSELSVDLDFEAEAESIFDSYDFNESYQNEESQYEYSKGEGDSQENYLASWLGGAPLIWVVKSPFITNARPCSPCVPNAGDLDTLDENGIECYDVNPVYREPEDE